MPGSAWEHARPAGACCDRIRQRNGRGLRALGLAAVQRQGAAILGEGHLVLDAGLDIRCVGDLAALCSVGMRSVLLEAGTILGGEGEARNGLASSTRAAPRRSPGVCGFSVADGAARLGTAIVYSSNPTGPAALPTTALPRRAALGFALLAAPARAQRSPRPRRLFFIFANLEQDPEGQARLAALRAGLASLGLLEGRDLDLTLRWTGGRAETAEHVAAEAVAAKPDAIFVTGGSAIRAVQRETRDIPIVFQLNFDPVTAGIVPSLAHPGGNATGFTSFEPGMPAKWRDLLRRVAPGLGQVFALSANVTGGLFTLDATSTLLRVETEAEIEPAFARLAAIPGAGLMVLTSAFAVAHRVRIVALAGAAGLPAIYPARLFVEAGGLMAYGPDLLAQYRAAAGYLARILAGDAPGNLPVQAPNRFELALNLATARALGLEMPTDLLAAADLLVD
jgi:putative ABC transport system substrate-binding protein